MSVYLEPERQDFWQLARDSQGHYLDPLGPLNCQPHSLSRAIMRHYEGVRPTNISGVWPPTGAWIRGVTRNPDGTYDRTGGTNLGQMEAVASRYYGMDLEVHYGLPWASFLDAVEATKGASLSIHYSVVKNTVYAGSKTFSDNHQIFVSGIDRARGVATGVIDPLCDGRLTSSGRVAKGPMEVPLELLKRAAGALDLDGTVNYRPLGYGLCYVGFTKATGTAPQPVTWTWALTPGATIRIYTLSSTGCIQPGWTDVTWGSTSSSAPCTAPVSRKTCDGASSATTVRITAGAYVGKTVRAFGDGVTTRRAS